MFSVRAADNFHYMDESETYTHGNFSSWDEAVAAARKVVDDSLSENYQHGMTADELFSQYTAFGDDPFIVPNPEGERFSGWDYAKERCAVICK
jgi:hypothetical protein